MAITSYSQTRIGDLVTVTVVSDLSGTIYYHWYSAGAYIGETTVPTRTFLLSADEQLVIDVNDTNDAAYDAIANAPVRYPATRSLWWIRSIVDSVVHYRIEQQRDGGDWTTIATIRQDNSWSYKFETPVLDDLTDYAWRIVPVDAAGNDGPMLTFATERIVRTPDAPRFTVSFDEGTTYVTFAAAA